MAVSAEMMENISKLSYTNRQSAARYIEYLLHRQQEESKKTHVKVGCLEGHLQYMSEDFDDPLEDFEEYM